VPQTDTSERGIGFAGILTLIFIVLKLVGVINWSWWWVLFLVWAPPAALLIIVAIFVISDWVRSR